MIERYSDHAANERTFLAWVRPAIAIMAFGFLVEKFDLFVSIAAREMADKAVAPSLGGLLVLLGAAMAVYLVYTTVSKF
jgi:putative membrane protein